jgi:hypothetical protein
MNEDLVAAARQPFAGGVRDRPEMPGIQGPKLVANIGSGRKTFA